MTTSFSLTSFCVLASFGSMVLGMLMAFLSVFLIMLILLQRGRGGGLSGALGGAGGQSAFGSKAGDTFTVLTISLAGIWIFVCAFAMWSLGIHAPSVANMIPDTVEAGPGSDAEDLASGLVIPTDADESDDDSTAADLIPEQEKVEAGLEAPAEMTEPAPAEEPAAEAPAEEPPAEAPPAEASAAEKPAAEAPAADTPAE